MKRYEISKPSIATSIKFFEHDIFVRRWPNEKAPALYLLHGWMDVSASFQFIVDNLSKEWDIYAPDWPGFGKSSWWSKPYYFPDYYAALEKIINTLSPLKPIHLVGHSMGGNIACMYAGIRPAKVTNVISLEGFGLKSTFAGQAPDRYSHWLNQLSEPRKMAAHADRAAFLRKLQERNPSLTEEKANFLVPHLALELHSDLAYAADPFHRIANPILYRIEEAKETWMRIKCPVHWVYGTKSELIHSLISDRNDWNDRISCFNFFTEHIVADAGHMLHYDQPAVIAQIIDSSQS